MGKNKKSAPMTGVERKPKKHPDRALLSASQVAAGGPSDQAKSPSSADKESDQGQRSRARFCPIVGIGASAGGLAAFTQLLAHLPADTGMAFVLVQHLDPRHVSILAELLSNHTQMPVIQVEQGMMAEPDHIYVIPPNTEMSISQRVLTLTARSEDRHGCMPIDFFLCTLAEDQRSNAIGVILSGTASDGTLGLKAIKGAGGITFAQDDKSAQYDGMPRSAIAAGAVDFVLPPEGIAKELARIASHPYLIPSEADSTEKQLVEDVGNIQEFFAVLRAATGVDFTHYKQATIHRRLMRRTVLHKMENLKNYLHFLQENPAEVQALFKDILINVTDFFRDADTFEALKKEAFPAILKNRLPEEPEEPIRVWCRRAPQVKKSIRSPSACWSI